MVVWTDFCIDKYAGIVSFPLFPLLEIYSPDKYIPFRLSNVSVRPQITDVLIGISSILLGVKLSFMIGDWMQNSTNFQNFGDFVMQPIYSTLERMKDNSETTTDRMIFFLYYSSVMVPFVIIFIFIPLAIGGTGGAVVAGFCVWFLIELVWECCGVRRILPSWLLSKILSFRRLMDLERPDEIAI